VTILAGARERIGGASELTGEDADEEARAVALLGRAVSGLTRAMDELVVPVRGGPAGNGAGRRRRSGDGHGGGPALLATVVIMPISPRRDRV
jgi:hypothetical protein